MLFTTLVLSLVAVGQGPVEWYEPFPAHKIVGNVYYVGSKDLATFLIATPKGHILINSGFERTVPLIQKSVESLGFKMTDVKILLTSHAHSDHVAGLADLQKVTGAKVYVMRGDDRVVASGGKGQYLYTTDRWDPCKVDRVLEDKDEVKLGDVTLVGRLTPGHTRGCTTWTWRVDDNGKKYDVVVIGSPNVNPGFQLVNNKDYPEIAADFAKTFEVLKSLPCDVFLGAHGSYYGMVDRYALLKKGQANAFVNPEGYKEYVAQKERAFRKILAEQQAKAVQRKAEQALGVTLYDPDPNHLWNRLHQALYVRLTDLGNAEKEQALLPGDQSGHANELDACLWPSRSTYLLFGEPHKNALAILDEFLAKDGEKLVKEPIKRAFLQRDLWAIFDWTRSWHSDAPRRDLRTRLAQAIQRLALSADEIQGLPDNFEAVAATKKLPAFPGELRDSRGPWVLIGDDVKGAFNSKSITPVHDYFFGGRSTFLVSVGEGDRRDKTIQLLKQLNEDNKPAVDIRVALVRRMLLIDNRGRIMCSPITESVQVRGGGADLEFKLNRKDLLAGKIQQSLHQIGADDRERPDILFLGNNAGDRPEPILKSCFHCHQGNDLNSRTQIFSDKVGPARPRPRLIESTLQEETTKSIHWKTDQFMWGKLQGLWEGELAKSDQGKAEQDNPPAVAAISDRLRKAIAAKEIAGAVTLVATPDRVIHLDATGDAGLNPVEKMQTDSIFWIASMSKPVLATLVLMLQDEGLLSVDDPVEKYLPEFKGLKTKDGQPARITIRHLLTHTSGMGEITADQARDCKTLAAAVPLYVAKAVAFTPGSKWVYCQSGINTAGRIAEAVTGEPLEKLMKRRLFDPLGMKDTTFYLTEKQLPRLAKSYRRTDKGDLEVTDIRFLNGKSPTSLDRFPAPNGGLFSTISDYARFCQMILRGGELDGKRYLTSETVKLMTSIQTGDLHTGFTEGNGWGLGWCVVREPKGITAMLSPGTFGHGGAYGTQAWIDPGTKRIYILMVQRANFPNSDASEVRRGFQEAANEAFSNAKRDIPYSDPADERQKLDVYSPKDAKNLPVVFWIHGGGWQVGDKNDVQIKPQVFMNKGFVFVSTNYRLLPNVDMATIVRDVAKSIHWVHDHIVDYGGDPNRLFIMGHSAGAQLAALVCTDDRYLKAEGLSLTITKGCVPVDGDTYDVPAIIETAETRRRVHGLPQAKFGHREKFGNDPAKHRDFSAVTHVAKDKGIPPFLILHVADHPDTSAQAQRLGNVLKDAGVPVTVFGARETTHSKINADLGLPNDPATKALFEFLGKTLK